LLLGVACEVAGQGRHSRHRNPVGVVHATTSATADEEFLAQLQLLDNGHQVGELSAPVADVSAVFGHRFAVVLLVRVHGHIAQPVDQHVEQLDVEPPACAYLDQYEVADAEQPGPPLELRAEFMEVPHLFSYRTLAYELLVHLPGNQQQVFV